MQQLKNTTTKTLNQNKMKKTAVEWLIEQFEKNGYIGLQAEKQALQMEKEQITDAFAECWKANVPNGIECKLDAEQYYNENFKSE